MINPIGATFSLLLLTCLFISGCAQAVEKEEAILLGYVPDTAQKVYQSGRSILLFSYREAIITSEAYADWQAYLNDFIQGEGKDFFYSIVETGYLKPLIPDVKEFTLFLKKGYPLYFYSGLIVEPQVYTAVYKRFTDQPLTGVDRAFLPRELSIPDTVSQ